MKTLRVLLVAMTLQAVVPIPKAKAAYHPRVWVLPTASDTAPAPVAGPETTRLSRTETARVKKRSFFQTLRRFFRAPGDKKLWLAALLAFLFGNLGVHRFYLGYHTEGLIQAIGSGLGLVLILAGFTASVAGSGLSAAVVLGILLYYGISIWAFVDFVRILIGSLRPKNGDYSDD